MSNDRNWKLWFAGWHSTPLTLFQSLSLSCLARCRWAVVAVAMWGGPGVGINDRLAEQVAQAVAAFYRVAVVAQDAAVGQQELGGTQAARLDSPFFRLHEGVQRHGPQTQQ